MKLVYEQREDGKEGMIWSAIEDAPRFAERLSKEEYEQQKEDFTKKALADLHTLLLSSPLPQQQRKKKSVLSSMMDTIATNVAPFVPVVSSSIVGGSSNNSSSTSPPVSPAGNSVSFSNAQPSSTTPSNKRNRSMFTSLQNISFRGSTKLLIHKDTATGATSHVVSSPSLKVISNPVYLANLGKEDRQQAFASVRKVEVSSPSSHQEKHAAMMPSPPPANKNNTISSAPSSQKKRKRARLSTASGATSPNRFLLRSRE